MKRTISLPAEVRQVLHQLRTQGHAAYAVGGCVRDSLRGEKPQDWDICTSATPQETAACFAGDRVVLTGARYGTVTVLRGGQGYEVTTFRAETGYSDSRHPDSVVFLPELRGDLMRRDFTINAMAAGEDGSVIDLFGGCGDLEAGVIRCVGAPEQRFSEDALRMLRALRFAARFAFSIAPETAQAIHALAPKLSQVSFERLRKELSGVLLGKNAAQILAEFPDVVCVLIPELKPCMDFWQYNPHHAYDVWQHTLRVVDAVEPEEVLRLAALLHDVSKPDVFCFDKNLVGHFPDHAAAGAARAEKILRRLRYDTATIRQVTELIDWHMRQLCPATERTIRRLLALAGPAQAQRLLCLNRADRLGTGVQKREAVERETDAARAILQAQLAANACFSLRQLAVSGKDLLALGIPQGRRMGEILQALLQAVISGKIPNSRRELCEYAQRISQFEKIN